MNLEDSYRKNFNVVVMIYNFNTCPEVLFVLVNEDIFLKTSQAYLILSKMQRMEGILSRRMVTRTAWYFNNSNSYKDLRNAYGTKTFLVGKFVKLQNRFKQGQLAGEKNFRKAVY